MREGLSVHVERVVVNGVNAAPFPDGLADLPDRLRRLPSTLHFTSLPEPPVLARCATHLQERYRLNQHYLDEIARSTGLPLTSLPYRVEGIRGPSDVAALGRLLVEAET